MWNVTPIAPYITFTIVECHTVIMAIPICHKGSSRILKTFWGREKLQKAGPIFPNEACLGFKCDQLMLVSEIILLNIWYKVLLDKALECSWNSFWAAGRKHKVCERPSMLVFPITNFTCASDLAILSSCHNMILVVN